MSTAILTVALAGNPNCGKTTIFNNITGARQHVGNYPGVTVEKREGYKSVGDTELLLVDLPGTYSLTAHSLDELVARNVIIDEKPDVILNILDASNLERNLYLAVQLLELERPVVMALNMADIASNMGMAIDVSVLQEQLGVSVISTVGNRNKGIDALLTKAIAAAKIEKRQPFQMDYGLEIEKRIQQVVASLASVMRMKYPLRWLAIKLLENDKEARESLAKFTHGDQVQSHVNRLRGELHAIYGEDVELVIAERRYEFVGGVYSDAVKVNNHLSTNLSDRIDSIMTHRILGLPIFFGIMWLLFNVVFTLGEYPQEWITSGVEWLSVAAGRIIPDGELKSLLIDGIIGGVGGVIGFLPNILLLFLGIALLEDSGYMARAAFVMDRVMRAVGLHGKSFIPMLIGFGCSVPAIMGTRTLENPRDRMVTILVAPLMSCSARLPVYTLLIGSFFSTAWAGTVLFSIYFIGIILAIFMALVFRKYLFPGASDPFVMEMPPYHLPTMKNVLIHMWERSVLYLKKAGTLIVTASILVWFATNYPHDVQYSKNYEAEKARIEDQFSAQEMEQVFIPLGISTIEENESLLALVDEIVAVDQAVAADKELRDDAQKRLMVEKTVNGVELDAALYLAAWQYFDLEQEKKASLELLDKEQEGEKLANSYAGQLGRTLEPFIKPLGFDWKIGVGLVSAMAAKEVLVSTLGTIYSVGDVSDDSTSLQEALASDVSFSPLIAFSLMAFTLIYSPCLAALAVMRRETNSWKWPVFSFVYSTGLAWLISFLIYQVGSYIGY